MARTSDRSALPGWLLLATPVIALIAIVFVWTAIDNIGEIGPLDKAKLGWLVAVPLTLMLPVLTAWAGGRLGRFGRPILAALVGLAAGFAVGWPIWVELAGQCSAVGRPTPLGSVAATSTIVGLTLFAAVLAAGRGPGSQPIAPHYGRSRARGLRGRLRDRFRHLGSLRVRALLRAVLRPPRDHALTAPAVPCGHVPQHQTPPQIRIRYHDRRDRGRRSPVCSQGEQLPGAIGSERRGVRDGRRRDCQRLASDARDAWRRHRRGSEPLDARLRFAPSPLRDRARTHPLIASIA